MSPGTTTMVTPQWPNASLTASRLASVGAGAGPSGTDAILSTLNPSRFAPARATVPVLPDDTEETLNERIKSVERTLYPDTIRTFVDRLAATAADGSGSPTEVAP